MGGLRINQGDEYPDACQWIAQDRPAAYPTGSAAPAVMRKGGHTILVSEKELSRSWQSCYDSVTEGTEKPRRMRMGPFTGSDIDTGVCVCEAIAADFGCWEPVGHCWRET